MTHNYTIEIIHYLKSEIEQYYRKHYRPHYEVTYEDIYAMANRVYLSELGNYPDPLIQSFFDRHLDDMLDVIRVIYLDDDSVVLEEILKITRGSKEFEGFRIANGYRLERYDINDIFQKVIEHIENNLINSISKPPLICNVDRIWNNIYIDTDLDSIDIFTLNHDTVLEALFWKKGYAFTDGFDLNDDGTLRIWNPLTFEEVDKRYHLYKLHGSFTWAYHSQHKTAVTYPLGEFSRLGSVIEGAGDNEILIGTFEKMLEYGGGIFIDLFWHFWKVLRKIDKLIVCGYGFRDKGINNYLIDWLVANDNRKIIVIHPDLAKLMDEASPAFRNLWSEKNDKFINIPYRMETVTWECIKNNLR